MRRNFSTPMNMFLKKLKEFKPEFLLFSAGFDAHRDDPLSNINLQSHDYFEITKRTLLTLKIIVMVKLYQF